MESEIDRDLAALKKDYPGWEIWVVHCAIDRPTWCARRDGARLTDTINTKSAADLRDEIEEDEQNR